MKKIIVVVPRLSGRGGTETVLTEVDNLVNNTNEYSMKLFLLSGTENEEWLRNVHYDMPSSLVLKKNTNKAIRYLVNFKVLCRYLLCEKPNLVISTNTQLCQYIYIARMLTKGKYPIVSWIHFSLNAPNTNIKKRLLKFADFHLAVSSGISEQLKKLKISTSNIYTIYNPIKEIDCTIKRPINKTVFIYIGRITFEGQKRMKDLLISLSKISGDWQLDVYGDGKDVNKCKTFSRELGIDDRVIWHGWVDDPWSTVKEATALVLTSEYEGFGMVLVEALSRGVYCISSNCEVGPADIIKDNENGRLFNKDNLNELQSILQNIVDGEALPSQKKLKESITNFYTHQFIKSFIRVIKDINMKWYR
ncbi:glycosyltransferase [Heyndrickxia faecalis]|uniref:glycosyltransferase n=1 Tax=Heyndrickxia TaxID=2837504 RepID=UPI002E1EE1EC|nr:glycosyltransferase [Weizmannia sp. CD-2023]MED4322571.1 glycosyltransferase [Weizmannia sp. CD-2023]MED4866959.1 glycosyltransferase [Weizmannia sp. CD-2023]